MIPLLASALIGYLIGGIPFGVIAARLRGGRDPRTSGSGHTGGLNTLRSAGRAAFLITGAGDIATGVAAVMIARAIGSDEAGAVTASVTAIAGHCGSIYIGFKGGMGLGTFIGLAVYWMPIGLIVLVPLWFELYANIRHAPRTSTVVALLAAPVFARLGGSSSAIAFGTIGGVVIAVRHLHDWHRKFAPAG